MVSSKKGCLFYVIGASGSGKDSLIAYARKHISDQSKVIFMHRYITRPPELQGENHVFLDAEEFEYRDKNDFFSMQWDSHNLRYAIGKEIDFWLDQGVDVVVNGSRGYLLTALEKYPDMNVLLITCSIDVLCKRLIARGRESGEEISERIERARQFIDIQYPNVRIIKNDDSIEKSGHEFVQLLQHPERIGSIA
ncbi:MAG: phosphonate metabolism protein/1,5-bisphosphokinase (PRPP-forming) PhnN [Methyloprofundus sp.]|nr:phosphonate metabolism protein/1,5-bisphosphokinase (PRPP-forming) PhnN [Methyloprofundus sp.]MBW6453463.1 phosphonate metabolism protein/1,5-bisphosphokinase (PRPP-forming) PhnN [Methyloprofundus sp.]